ncbi:uncharacterized protein LOC121426919 [Lytechinus variegatus]|uniref:uncharacterized protein LOC121426919 n=1 Tax=Lytechinus variegatus TaxID=7654 RepID=UPI001BB22AAC|nr:uncharacterized protein LOC121426919 [Lytechinus variegatus]
MTSRQVRRTQSAPHLTSAERRRVQMAVVEGTLYIRRRHALSQEDNYILEEDEENEEEQPMMVSTSTRSECTSSVSSLISEGSMTNGVKESNGSRRVRILTNLNGKSEIFIIVCHLNPLPTGTR